MATMRRDVRLAGEKIGDDRHLCVLVEGPDEADLLLMPFIVEGFEQGDRAFHIVDPALRDAHIERLQASGIRVEETLASRQLEVQTWTDAYLRGGAFDGSAQLEYVKGALDEGRELGFPRTRLIGSMEWSLDEGTARDLIQYEKRIDVYLRTVEDITVCTYDLNHHSARTIAQVMSAHPVAFVGGVLRMSREPARASARERLLIAASRLFTEAGIQATGVDAIIEAADVAKATFYRHFPSKDDLVVAWLRDSRTRWFDRVRARSQASSADPRGEILLFFEAVAAWLDTDGYRGCPYLNTSVEITDPAHPARLVIHETLDEIGAYLRGLLEDAGYPDAERRGMELHALLAGSISLAVARQTNAFAITARETAQRILQETPSPATD
jgi:AcrR family transcriptional regulator